MPTITLPHNYQPRTYQLPLLAALDGGCKRAVAVWHRRAGKDKTLVAWLAKRAFERVGTYYYLFPTYSQGRKILWDGMDGGGFPFVSHFPDAIVAGRDKQLMQLRLTNGSIVQVIGTDNIDSIVGTNPVGCVFSEYALQDPIAWDLLRPILRENGGWAVFDYTPRGHNHGFDLYEMARTNPDWYVSLLNIEDTGVLTLADIEAERREGMDEELIQQEYYCSFEGSRQGAYYGQQLRQAQAEGRICSVPYAPQVGVETWWDLGVADGTAIWFTQSVGREVRVIDYYEASGEGLPHYAQVLNARGYTYTAHHAPHDIEVRELGTGKSRLETALAMGIRFETGPMLGVADGIEAVRGFLAGCWIDQAKCERGLKALWSYHKDYDEARKVYRSQPCHDWSSHAADSFRYLSVGHKHAQPKRTVPREERYYETGEPGQGWMAA